MQLCLDTDGVSVLVGDLALPTVEVCLDVLASAGPSRQFPFIASVKVVGPAEGY